MQNLLLKRRVRRLVQKAEKLLLSDSCELGHRLAEEAYQLSRAGLAPESAEYVLSAFLAGSARVSANDLGGAERALADAARNADASLADDPMRAAAVFNNLAIVYSRTKRPKQSIPLMKRAIEIKRRLYGQGDVRYIENLQDLVAAFEAAGEPGEEPDEDALAAIDDMERELAQAIPEMQMTRVMAEATVESVSEALPTASVLVEFFEYSPYNFSWARAQGGVEQFPPRYVAFVLHAGAPDSLRSIDLGEATELASSVHELVKQASVSMRALDPAPVDHASTNVSSILAARLLAPLVPMLGDAQRLLLAPDGELCLLPFELLQFENGQLLFERCEVSYIGTGRDALRFQSIERRDLTAPVIFADPDFDLVDSGVNSAVPEGTDDLRSHLMRGFAVGSSRFGPLPGTRIEADRISAILPNAIVYFGPAALESRMRELRAPGVLHLATHGFFLPDEKEGDEPDLRGAMYASGLAFAGANSFLARRALPTEAEDGILTAEDVATLNLLDTELVVLSACDTALGTPVRGEGVFGLRRAFFVAGARTVVMSLWPVPDLETAELMAAFYSFVAAGMPKPTALRKAKQTLRDAGAPVSAWAPFICEGDWRSCRAGSMGIE